MLPHTSSWRRQLSSNNLHDLRIVHGLEDANCRITGTSIVKRKGFLIKRSIVYHVKVIDNPYVYVVDCLHDDFTRLYKSLKHAPKTATDFVHAIAAFPCPKKSMFGSTDALLIKGMCGQLENHLTNVLKICRHFSANSHELKVFVDNCIFEFITRSDPVHAPAGRCHPVARIKAHAVCAERCRSSTVV
ncbi:hypothetical protein THRCLA_01613 [Thraustotheca clavata]|uniref:PX domain-containing protein n=1 Tax=Thraustotheca clavata TaxID=74557 RepID=A0A1W0A7R9_9STRA|nr:hypothetical protein THRCLA_01613 [Thraustotheca clavata]